VVSGPFLFTFACFRTSSLLEDHGTRSSTTRTRAALVINLLSHLSRAFVILGYQHCIAYYFLIPIGMMQGGADLTVGKFIYQSIIPVTVGNIVGAVFIIGLPFYWCYGRVDELDLSTGPPVVVERKSDQEKARRENHAGNGVGVNGERWRSASSEATVAESAGSGNRHTAQAYGGSYDRNGMVDAA